MVYFFIYPSHFLNIMENKDNVPNHGANTLSEFVEFAFPKITGKVSPRLLSDSIATLEQMGLTEKQIINGRTVKAYPEKYDDFNTPEDLCEFIRNEIHANPELKWEWLNASSYSTMRFQDRKDLYYTPVASVGVYCIEPRGDRPSYCFRQGKELLRLNPNKWSYAMVKGIVESLKVANK